MPKTDLTKNAYNILYNNGRDFLNHALELMFNNAKVKFTVVNLQMALELFIKFRLVKQFGLQSICNNNLSRLKNPANALIEGKIKTNIYNDCKNKFKKLKKLNKYEQELLENFQQTRNAIVHFGKEIDHKEFEILSGHLIAKVFRRIIEDEAEPWLFKHLQNENYKNLITFKPYIDEAVDDAFDQGEEVLLCFECENETLVVTNEDYYCFCCGMTFYGPHAPYIKCPFCKEKAMVYDALNNADGVHKGKCISCQEDTLISFCSKCGVMFFPELDRFSDSKPWRCIDCPE
jgi:hypothetical protein